MKKLPHQLPSRKSPRLSSSSSPAAAASASYSSPSTRHRNEADDAWALSLHVAEQQPFPICYPITTQEDNSIRRSTRFTSNIYKTPSPQSRRSCSHAEFVPSKLSTSPTIFFSSSAPKLTLTDGENAGTKKSERCLRSRTVLTETVVRSVSGRREKGKKAAAENGGNCGLIDEGESPLTEMLAFPLSRKDCLKPRSGAELHEECLVTPKVESSLVESPDKEQCSLVGVSEKRLRSRNIQLKQNVAEKAVRKPDQNGGGRNEESAVRPEKKEKSILCCFVGEPIPEEEAQRRWQWRYDLKVSPWLAD